MKELIKIEQRTFGTETLNAVSIRELYLGLGLDAGNWSRWYPQNVLANGGFFVPGVDFVQLLPERSVQNPNPPVDFAATIDFAKHIAMMARTEKAHDYRNYFIDCERKAKEFRPPTFAPSLTVDEMAVVKLRTGIEAATLLGCPLHLAQSEAVKTTRRETGIDYTHLLAFAPAQDNIKAAEVMLEPTELGKAMGWGSAIAANKELAALGLQVKTAAGWEPTETGQPLSQRHTWTVGAKSGYNYKWNLNAVKACQEEHTPS
jgi:phage anti-repressor protein